MTYYLKNKMRLWLYVLNMMLLSLIHTNEPIGHQISGGKQAVTLKADRKFRIKAYPENKIILAHWGGGIFFYALLKKEIREALKNVWFDTAAISIPVYSGDLSDSRDQLSLVMIKFYLELITPF